MNWHKLETSHVHEPPVGQLELGYDLQTQEAQHHEGIPGPAELVEGVPESVQLPAHRFEGPVRDQPGDGQGQQGGQRPMEAALLLPLSVRVSAGVA